MAEREKRRATTFRTSRGAVVNVSYPDIYIAPGLVPEDLRYISIFIDNGLNQAVMVQVKANRENSHTKAVNTGSSFAVLASNQDARSLSVGVSGWLPYIMVEVSCTVAPISGSLTLYRIRSKDEQDKLVDALAIRDITTHTPTTDPTTVLIQEW